jgi:uncharacterized protein (TIGR03000 family)
MRRVLAVLGVPALALACLLSFAGPSFAQHRGHWGGGHWAGRYGGWGGGYHYGGWGWGHRGWGGYYGGWWPGYYGGGYYSPYYSGYYSPHYYGYSWPYYSYTTPYYYSPVYADSYAVSPPAQGSVTPAATDANRTIVRVHVRADAQVTFDKTAMTETGTDRSFVTPPLDPNQRYSYHITAKWMDNGRQVEEERTVRFTPGQTVNVDFSPATTNANETNPIR